MPTMRDDYPILLDDATLQAFYEAAVLPQFGIVRKDIQWHGRTDLGPDEMAFYFSLEGIEHILIYEDYGGLGQNDEYIRNEVLVNGRPYEFVLPTSATAHSPSYDGFNLPPPSCYCEGVTGTFTLIRLT